jgi:hypothetical protein
MTDSTRLLGHTEVAAQSIWCPESRLISPLMAMVMKAPPPGHVMMNSTQTQQQPIGAAAGNRDGTDAGSRPTQPGQSFSGVDRMCLCRASRCMAWRWLEPDHNWPNATPPAVAPLPRGYCGKYGQPFVPAPDAGGT